MTNDGAGPGLAGIRRPIGASRGKSKPQLPTILTETDATLFLQLQRPRHHVSIFYYWRILIT